MKIGISTATATIIAGTGISGALVAAPTAGADVAPPFPPGVYNVAGCEDRALTYCPEDPVQWDIADGGPGVIRVSRLPNPVADAIAPPWTMDLTRRSNGWEGQRIGGSCTNAAEQKIAANMTITLSISDGGEVFTGFTGRSPDCTGEVDDGDYYKLTRA